MIEMIALVWFINFFPKEKVYPRDEKIGVNPEPSRRRRAWFGPAGEFCFCKIRVYENSIKKEKTRS